MTAVLQLERPYTVDDLKDLPEDGLRYEIIGGELIVSPSPSTKHQLASMNLSLLVAGYVRRRGIGVAFAAPYDVVLGTHNVLEPDLLVILNEQADMVTDAHVVGAPALVIEIISPSSRSIDRVRKSATYADHGVQEYWIVDPDTESIIAQKLVNGVYQPIPPTAGLVHSEVVAGLIVDPGDVFAPPTWQRDTTA
ncbi:MAG: Uma2 family endonuclease [Thermomicrobiales bacterium]|jgi:Uma2 family endonuclease|nr:Uma2 family endonuclease [Thermomicrobiales bacterium]